MPSLDSMPTEIILQIVDCLPCTRNHAAALARCNRQLHAQLSPLLPKRFARAAIRWASEDGMLQLLKSALGDTSDSPITRLPPNGTAYYDISASYYDDNDKYWEKTQDGVLRQNHWSLVLAGHFRTPLHMACANGHNDIVNYLLDKGADINGRAYGCCDCTSLEGYFAGELGTSRYRVGYESWEPLHIAMCYKQQSTALLLLQRGASTSLSHEQEPALHFAISNGLQEVVRWFRTEYQKGNPALPPVWRQGRTVQAMHAVALLNNFDAACAIVKDLQELGLHIDGDLQERKNPSTNNSPLLFAVCLGNYSAARALMVMGASPLAARDSWESRFCKGRKDKATTVLQLAVRARYVAKKRGEEFEQSYEDWLRDRRACMTEVVRRGCPPGLGLVESGRRGIPPLQLALDESEKDFLVGLGADVSEEYPDHIYDTSSDEDSWDDSEEDEDE